MSIYKFSRPSSQQGPRFSLQPIRRSFPRPFRRFSRPFGGSRVVASPSPWVAVNGSPSVRYGLVICRSPWLFFNKRSPSGGGDFWWRSHDKRNDLRSSSFSSGHKSVLKPMPDDSTKRRCLLFARGGALEFGSSSFYPPALRMILKRGDFNIAVFLSRASPAERRNADTGGSDESGVNKVVDGM